MKKEREPTPLHVRDNFQYNLKVSTELEVSKLYERAQEIYPLLCCGSVFTARKLCFFFLCVPPLFYPVGIK